MRTSVKSGRGAAKASPRKKAVTARQPTLAELNRRLAATRAERLQRAEANCLKITGKPRL